MADYGRPPSQQTHVFISFGGQNLRQNFVPYLHQALKRDGINSFIDERDGMGFDSDNLVKMIDESSVALVILSSRYTESRWCLEELVKIKERADEGKLVAIPIFWNLKVSDVRRLEGIFGLNLWYQLKLTSKFQEFQAWKEALDFISQIQGLVWNESSDEAALIAKIVMYVKDCLTLKQIEDSHFSRSEELKRVEDVTVDVKSYVNPEEAESYVDPEEAESVHGEATFYEKSRRDDVLNLRKDDNFLGDAHSDATSNTQYIIENTIVDPVNEENKQGKVGKSSDMVTYDEYPPQHQVFINFRGAELRNNFVSHLLMALKRDAVNVFVETGEERGLDIISLFKRIEESRIALVIFSSRYTESTWCLEELVKIKERMEKGKLVAIPIFYKVNPSQVRRLEGDFGLNRLEGDFGLNRLRSEFGKPQKQMEALDFVSQTMGLVFNEFSDEAAFVDDVVMHVKKCLLMEQIKDSQFQMSEKQKDGFVDTPFSRSEELKSVEGETVEIFWDAKSDLDPEEAESGHIEAGNLRKDDNLLGEAHCDATSNKQKNTIETKIVDPDNEENKQRKVGKSFDMVTYDEQPTQHQVFINFRGAELRKNFVSHLFMALKRDGVNVFMDTDEERGLDIKSHFKRIDESRIALVIFSSRYTESTWCLEELVKIKERMEEGKLLVIPIYYKVTTSEVRHLMGDFGVKFWNAWRINRDSHIIKWKEALKSVTSIMGISLNEHSSESEIISYTVNIVRERISLLEGENPSVFACTGKGKDARLPTGKGENHENYRNKDRLFGMEERMEQLEMKLKFDCKETRIVGVVGLPGIGKTTLARMLYEKWSCKFIRCVPLLGIRKMTEDDGPACLRKTVLEVLLEGKFPVISEETTHESLKDELLKIKIFAVLDDVSNKEQLEFLFGHLDWIKKGSKIVITTCDKSLLEGIAHDSYVVPLLNDNDSLKLFSYNAFGGQICSPTGKYEALSKKFVDYAKGHPLALNILGRELCGHDLTYWKHKLQKVTESPSMEIQQVWRISTDQLNVQQKDVFLDLVFFLKSEDEYFVRSLLDSGDPDTVDAVSEVTDLANKCLITISDGRVEMNDLLYTFGKDLCSQERHWLWKYKEITHNLTKKSDANNVRGLFLDMSTLTENFALDRMAFTNMLNLRYLKIYDTCCPRCKADYNLHFHDGLDFPLQEVQYFHWLKFPLNELPPDFKPDNLVDLRLPYSKIIRVWEGAKDTPRLKWVDLSHSSKLLDLSALSKSVNLRRLNLEGCTSLDELPVEIQNMKSLVFLNLRGCIRLSYLPDINLASLKTLILSGCANLEDFKLISESIVVLHLDGTAIKGLPPSIKKLHKLILLNLKDCRLLNCLPTCLRELKALEELILSGCASLQNLSDVRESMKHLQVLLIDRIGAKEMPDICKSEDQPFADMFVGPIGPTQWPLGIPGGSSLQRLSLSGNDFFTLQTDIGQLYNLKWLDVKQCKNLIFIPTLPPRLQYFDAHGCDSLERVAIPLAFPMIPEQIHATFNFSNCNKLDEDAKDCIMSYTRRRSQLILAELTQCSGGFILEGLIRTCFPGWEVPMWFSHQASGSVLEPTLPPHWCDNQFIGIALSAVVQFPSYHEQRNRLLVKCNCVFTNKDGSRVRFSCTIGSWSEPSNTPGKIEPSHVFIGYASMLDIKNNCEKEDEEGCSRTQALLEFQVTDGAEVLEGCEVLKCGFNLVYATDERENMGWDTKTVVVPEEIENSPGEVRSYGSPDDIQYESYSLGRGETFFSEAKFDATRNLLKIFENKRVYLLPEESVAGGIASSSYHDDTSSVHLEKLKRESLVGVELRLEQLEKVLYSTPGETRIVGVVGMSGIGKTTLARILFEKHRGEFTSHLFITVSEDCRLEQLRRLFLKELLKHVNQDINDDTTHESLEDKLRQTEVFVVLDAVSSKKQLEFLLGNLNWIKKGSMVVITTCKKSLIERLAQEIYVVPQLNNEEAFQLLTYHAFYNQICSSETFLALSRMFVDSAGGNPQLLEAIGKLICGKDETYWQHELLRVRKTFSIFNLNERQIDPFLDIVYFFKSEDEYFVRRLLDSGNPDDVSEVRDLKDKFIITISGGRVKVHDHMYILGKQLGSFRPTRLCEGKDIDKLKKMKQREANNVRGIFLDMSEMKESIAMECMTFSDMRNILYLKIYDSCCHRQCKADRNLYFPDGLEFSLEELRYLHWVNFPLEELPPDFRPENLVDLRLPYSKIRRVWEGAKDTPRLKWVDLSYSSKLLDLSALSNADNLERLNLEGCTSLDKLPVEIENMKSLVFLNLRGCICLRSLPKMNLVSLKTLILSDCSNLKEFQLISESVEFLHLDGTAIKRLPPGIQNLQRLVLLNLKNCKMLECLPNCLSELKFLDELTLSGCSRLKNLPEVRHSLKHLQILLFDGTGAKEMPSISCFAGSEGPSSADMFLQRSCDVNELYSIRRLCLNGNDFVTLQPDIGKLYNLKWIDIKDCKKLRFVPALPPRLQYFDAHGCDSLEKVANPLAFPVMSEEIHATFNFSNCNKLDQDAKNHIMSYARQKSQIVLDKLTRCNGGLVLEALIGTCFPGWEVPAWFSYRASGSTLTPKLPPHWRDYRFTGIGLCAVIVFPNHDYQRKHVVVKCNGTFKNEDESIIRFSCIIGGWRGPSNTPRKIESSHVFIGFTSRLDINIIGEENNEEKKNNEEKCVCAETSVAFQVTDGTEEIKGCEVLKCGFSFVYAPEERRTI